MGFVFRKRVNLGKDSWVNVSRSGASVSQRFGPVTFNSRGGGSVKLGNGVSYRFGKRRKR